MNWDQIKGQWKQLKGSARRKWGEITDDELEQAQGDRDRLIGLVQERYGIAREAAEKQVDEWSREI
ncbi:CsbD family protein [Maritimibacter sp. 55A14]|uniref:CsbD family protein n=1 Tax=Maritimibacter sp. 55A14 TaxID=2174844 RepID=UPI000D60B87B|nr:CsbD family protein [Maritimibacter sp. 55A14]PWE33624.1 CsbD family protein [Maritimibacter sp. 55A14]